MNTEESQYEVVDGALRELVKDTPFLRALFFSAMKYAAVKLRVVS